MNFSPKLGIQGGGAMRRWNNPARAFPFSLVRVDFDCLPDPYAGVLVLTSPSHAQARLIEVRDPRKEFPSIFAPLPDDTVAYWKIVKDDAERTKVVAGLTPNPIFDDNI